MRLHEIEREYGEAYRIGYRHNPKHFYGNSFGVETHGRRLVVVGVAKRHLGKRFRIVGVLKSRNS